MLLIYRLLINILFPLIILIIFFRTKFNKEDKIRFKEKLFSGSFKLQKRSDRKLIWFHAASIGELNSIIPLIKKINKKNKFDFLVTTVTLSSSRLILKELIDHKNIVHRFFPIDKPSLVYKFLNGWSPDLILFVDSEIWPNFILEIKKRKIPLILLNGRITKKTYLKWNLISSLAEKIFQTFELCLPSSKESKKYLEKFKVKNIKFLGNLKLTSENKLSSLEDFNKAILINNKFWCAISTHKNEELFCLKTHLIVKKIHKNIITIIIPRHIDRAESIKSDCKKLGLKSQILSEGDLINDNKEIIIINSYGVMSNYLSLCKSVFIGKSIIKKLEVVGGQNPIEAAKFGCKIYHGPFVYNFQEIYDLLNTYKIAEEIYNEEELSEKLINDLNQLSKIENRIVEVINGIGNKILADTYGEIDKVLNR